MAPTRAACPRCSDAARITVEHVIQGGKSYRSCHCSACDHQWQVAETGDHVPQRNDDDRPDRSRSLG